MPRNPFRFRMSTSPTLEAGIDVSDDSFILKRVRMTWHSCRTGIRQEMRFNDQSGPLPKAWGSSDELDILAGFVSVCPADDITNTFKPHENT